MMDRPIPTRPWSYERISNDPEGRELGVKRQRQDNERLRQQLGWPEFVKIKVDNDAGASTRSKKPRPGYDEIIAAIMAGECDGVLFYSNSRLTRRPAQWEDLIQLHTKYGVIYQAVVSGSADLSTADGRATARTIAAWDAAEAERIAERVSRGFKQRREDFGLPSSSGRRPFGYEPGGLIIKEREAEAVREGARILLGGGSPGMVARAWTKAKISPVVASFWSDSTIRHIYQNPRTAGWVTYKGEIVRRGEFPALLPEEIWLVVKEQLTPKSRGTNARVHVYSGFVICSLCGTKLAAQGEKWACVKGRGGCGKIARNYRWLCAQVDAEMDRLLALVPAEEIVVEAADEHAAAIADAEARIAGLRGKFTARQIEGEDFYPTLAGLRDEVNMLKAKQTAAVRQASSIQVDATVAEMWADKAADTLHLRRKIVAKFIKSVVVKPIGKTLGRRPIPTDSIEFVYA